MAFSRIKGFGCHAQDFVKDRSAARPGGGLQEARVTHDLGMPRPSAMASMTVG
jgi:hypothetical protein